MARHVLAHWADPRPAWLWSHDGATLLWRNPAARYVRAKLKKNGLKLTAEAVPIRGQVQRLIRLGRPGQSSLSRVQFLVGDKPLALTCACLPVPLWTGETGLLLVGEDKVDKDIREAAAVLAPDRLTEALLPAGSDYLLVANGTVAAGSSGALASEAPRLGHEGLPAPSEQVLVAPAGPKGQTLLVYLQTSEEAAALEAPSAPAPSPSPATEPELPMGLDPIAASAEPQSPDDSWTETVAPAADGGALTSLFDRLADDSQLFSALSAADETFTGPPPDLPAPVSAAELEARETLPDTSAIAAVRAEDGETADDAEPDLADMPEMMLPVSPEPPPAAPLETAMVEAVIDYAADEDETPPASEAETAPVPPPRNSVSHWLISGRGFRPARAAGEPVATGDGPGTDVPTPADVDAPELADVSAIVDDENDAAAVERVTRYNFEELGRILTDRVAGEPRPEPPAPAARPEGVVSLSAETLVLNRLPLAILVFRDQQVLFANRALTDLLAYESVEALRASGIAAIFPAEEAAPAGPVNQLVRRDGTLLGVSARLQSVSWQGRPALMLSATQVEPTIGHEGAVRAFAELSAQTRGDGFVRADRAGTITEASPAAAAALGREPATLIGKPLAVLIAAADMDKLRAFLEKPARFAETARPALATGIEGSPARLSLFAEGQAGTVTGYFGFVSNTAPALAAPAQPTADDDPALLARLSRGLRRPLNTIIGFADLIRTTDFAAASRERYVEYAQDIRTAGLEIAVLVDEIDDYSRLNGNNRHTRQSEIDLQALLENCVIRVKAQAGAARVLVRSAIAERLPLIRADRASLSQALLNLLASAIDTTPVGGSVILSAQLDDDGNVAVHVRDGSQAAIDVAERFVVFRDGTDKEGAQLEPVRSAMGLALTRSLLAVNECSLSIDPTAGVGTLFTLQIPAELVVRTES